MKKTILNQAKINLNLKQISGCFVFFNFFREKEEKEKIVCYEIFKTFCSQKIKMPILI